MGDETREKKAYYDLDLQQLKEHNKREKSDLEHKLENDTTNYEKSIRDLKEELADVKDRLLSTTDQL